MPENLTGAGRRAPRQTGTEPPDNEISLVLRDVTLRATVTGAGPTVLLLHAGGERRQVWAPVAAELAQHGLRTVAYDLRGHGRSSGQASRLRTFADDAAAMVQRETAPIVVVGASLGGLAALTALAAPAIAQRVAGLVLVDVVPDADPARIRSWLHGNGLQDRFGGLVEDILQTSTARFAVAAELDLPILLVRAGRESPLSDADADRLHRVNRRVTVVTVRGASHLVARDAPAELAHFVAEHATKWLDPAIAVNRAFALQLSLGASQLSHPGGTLHAHLRRVHSLTASWHAAAHIQLAAICHATYGTDGFGCALLPVADRRRLQEVIGPEAEQLAYLYGACDRGRTYPGLGRAPLRITDRFTGVSRLAAGAELHDFAVLTIANELDIARHAAPPAAALSGIRRVITALASCAPEEAACALADEALAPGGDTAPARGPEASCP